MEYHNKNINRAFKMAKNFARITPGITDVCIGIKEQSGKLTDTMSIIFFVKEKVGKRFIPQNKIIPTEFNGIPTDVQKELSTSHFYHNSGPNTDLRRIRPLRSGIAITTEEAPDAVGTLGFFAIRNSDKKKVLVSNYHVLFRNLGLALDVKTSVFQPNSYPENLVGKVTDTSCGAIGGSVDCAYAIMEETGCCCCKAIIGHENTTQTVRFKGVARAALGQKVYKHGISTSTTVGKIISVNKSITGEIDYSEYYLPAGGRFSFSNLIMIVKWDDSTNRYDDNNAFSTSGDSGAAIYNENGEIVGLHFMSYHNPSTGRHYSFACHIESVENSLRITVPGTRYESNIPDEEVAIALNGPISADEGSFFPAGQIIQEAIPTTTLEELYPDIINTENRKKLLEVINRNSYEVISLLEKNRAIKVTWHKKQGPAFIAALNRGLKYNDYKIPQEIHQIKIQELLNSMAGLLMEYGSEPLCQDIKKYGFRFIQLSNQCQWGADYLNILDQIAI